ncbi:hypothetical protein FY528_02360 [Hymenobacter lutimineralis]|uniref:Uncharacterized protein n=1 Tax=Hymenobacter lutimineralis TaxID=2606448 RepID=A0A5D6VDC8_9BACT|nr:MULTISPECIES: hypothetical protein [Hymenobacter]QIX61059.1 hypothetical protein HER32_07635 [Hymenobacter sp. BT18]TYZ13277.1 hypothetical protein FY528_02360 [Hymenobacter lutimineralis]
MRSWLVLLLLLNYLLMVGAGLVHRPDSLLREQIAHPYHHSAMCQQENYLRLDCFERCNGNQRAWHPRTGQDSPLHLLSLLHGLDTHLLAAVVRPDAPLMAFQQPENLTCWPAAAVPAGVRTVLFAPPRRG